MTADRWRHLTSPLAEAYRATGLWRGVLLDSYLADSAARKRNHTAVVDGGVETCYGEIWDRVVAVTAGLRRLGVQAGDVVSWILPNWLEASVIHHAVIRLGAVSNPIVPIYRHREVQFILAQARSKVVIVPELFRDFDYPAMVTELSLPDLDHTIVVRGSKGEFLPFEDLLDADPGADGAEVECRSGDDPVLLLYTSGTTAQPKGAVHSHNTMDHELRSIVRLFGLTAHDTVFMPSPLTHITGILYGIHLPALLGCPVVLQDVWDPAVAAELINRHGASFTVGATPFLHGLIGQPDPPGGRLTMRVFACGGADVPPQLIRDATNRLECCVVRVYGSTEHPTVSSGGFADDPDKRAATDGRPIGVSEVRVVDADGRDLGPGAVGELLVRGPEQFLGYLDADLASSCWTSDGWFRTGDLGSVDPNGYLTIAGRLKDIIVRGGENLSVKEIEDLLLEHPMVADVAVVAMPDPVLTERVCAFVVPATGEPALGELARFLDERGIAKQKLPERLVILPELPRTASGKVQKYLLREQIKAKLGAERESA